MGFYYDLFEDAMEKLAYEEEIEFLMEKRAGRLSDAAGWAEDKIDKGKDWGRRAWEKTKDMTRAGYGKVKGGVKAVGSHLWRQKGRYGLGAAAAGLGYGGYAAGRRNRKDR